MLSALKTKSLSILALCITAITLFSFSKAGGEGFEIYLDNKLVMQRFGNQLNTVQELQLDQRYANQQLVVKYHHCGKVGKNRVMTVKNGKDKILKQWRFADEKTPVASMACNVKEILDLGKLNTDKLKLYYASSELPDGRMLASITFNSRAIASR